MQNEVNLMGNLGGDPEIGETERNARYAKFSLATSERWKDKTTGEKREKTEWHRVIVWGDGLTAVIANYCKKGSRVMLRGKLQTRKWQAKDGSDRWSTEVVLNGPQAQLTLMDRKDDNRPPPPQSPDDYGQGDPMDVAA